MGRKKIEMKMVKDTGARQVTFSKRRNGLFKKAHELATLCAAQLAIVVFSPGGKPFSFGHPNVDSVAQRFLNQETSKPKRVHVNDPRQACGVEELNRELTDLLKQLQIEKERGKQLDKALKEVQEKCNYTKPIHQLDQDEVLDMKRHLEQLRQDVNGHVREIEASSSLLLLNEPTNESDN